MIEALRHNLTSLFRFSGRDTRSQFWPWAAVVVALVFIAMFAVMVPTVNEAMARMQRFAAEHPELARVTQGPGSYSIEIEGYHPELFPDLRPVFYAVAGVAAAAVALLGAAVARRLHDSGKAGWWGLMPVPFLATGLTIGPQLFESFGKPGNPNFGLFGLLFLNNLIYLGLLIFLIALLAKGGTPGPNRYGEPPA